MDDIDVVNIQNKVLKKSSFDISIFLKIDFDWNTKDPSPIQSFTNSKVFQVI